MSVYILRVWTFNTSVPTTQRVQHALVWILVQRSMRIVLAFREWSKQYNKDNTITHLRTLLVQERFCIRNHNHAQETVMGLIFIVFTRKSMMGRMSVHYKTDQSVA